jgi:hypothetical protein
LNALGSGCLVGVAGASELLEASGTDLLGS